jgi:hypothetical protein
LKYLIPLLTVLILASGASAGELRTVPGSSLIYYIVNNGPLPKTAFILFPGGDGVNHVRLENGQIKLSDNFLVRTSDIYVKSGFTTVIVSSQKAMSDSFRQSNEQSDKVQAIINELGNRGIDKVFLVGTSRGTITVASLASNLTDARIKGIILTSSMNNLDVHQVKVPVLFVHHVNDGCKSTTYQEAKRTSQRIKHGQVSFVDVIGGLPPQSDECKPLSAHGFFGVESVATNAMIAWARGH